MQAVKLANTRFLSGSPDLDPDEFWEEVMQKASYHWSAFEVEEHDGNEYLMANWSPVFVDSLSSSQRDYFDEPFDFDVLYDGHEATGTVTCTPYMYGYIFSFDFVSAI